MIKFNTDRAIDDLLLVMQTLRGAEGCPWDKQQTPLSLTPYILEEACELIDAIEHGTADLILDELGDMLLQVVFQAQIFSEQKQFEFNDVAAAIAGKLVRRHPHVFNREKADKSKDLDQQWDTIKRAESTQRKSSLSDHLPTHLPALQRAQKLIDRVWREKLQQYLPPIKDTTTPPLTEESLGQKLFELVQMAQHSGLDAESALRKFTRQATCQIESVQTNTLVANDDNSKA